MDKKEGNRSTHDLKKRFLECPICLEEFDESSKVPKVLPCLHTFCFACLQKIRRDCTLVCSLCSKSYDTSGSNFDTFPTDLTRRDLLDFVHADIEPEKLTCENCNESLPAKYRCKDCPSYLCEECNTTHSKVRKFGSHSIFCLDNVNKNAASKIQDFARQDTCDIVGHEQEKLEYYCKSPGCVKPICIKCFVSAHKDHNVPIIRDVYEENKQYLLEKGNGLVRRVDETDTVIKHVETTLVDLQLKGENADAEINASIDISMALLQKRREDLLLLNKSIQQQKSKTLELQLEDLKTFKGSLVASREFLDNSLSYRNEPAFMKIAKTIDDRFDNLLSHQISQLPHETEDLEFNPINMGNAFAISTHELGVILSEKIDPKFTEISLPDALFVNQQNFIDVHVRNSRGQKLAKDNLVDIGLEISYGDEDKQLASCDVIADGILQATWVPNKEGTHHLQLVYMCKKQELGNAESNVIAARMQRDGFVTSSDQNAAIECPDFHLDAKTLHFKRYLSRDRKTLFNIRCKVDEQPEGDSGIASPYDWPEGKYKKYQGTRGSLRLKPHDKVYFEVSVIYNIIKDLTGVLQLFEIGIAGKDMIDRKHTVSSNKYGWCVAAVRDTTTGKLAIEFGHNGQTLFSETLSDSTSGTTKTLTLGIYVNTQDSQMSVVDVDTNVLMYTFTDIDFTKVVTPVFGVYNPYRAHVTLQLKTSKYIKGLPTCLPVC